MNNKGKNEGISLIVLVITIIVIIILAGSVILSLSNNNPIASANEAVYKSDVASIQSQLALYASTKYSETSGAYDITQMSGKVSDFVSGLTTYDSEFEVTSGRLSYIGNDLIKMAMVSSMGVETDVVNVSSLKYNKPDISFLPEATTKAIKWDSSNVESQLTLSQASTDTTWYDYSTKKWANIKTSNNGNDAYWVWIPRYAYKITTPHTTTAQQINIIFLAGTSNNPADGTALPSGYIVHPGFTFGGKQLTGIWVAKYEASSNTPNAVDGTGYTGGSNTGALQVRSVPNVYSWRNISVGNSQTASMNMVTAQGSVGTTTNIDSHLIKNIEWGAVAYLSQSMYGTEPWINPYGDRTAGSYKMKTGYSGENKDSGQLVEGSVQLHPYNDLTYGVKASTTGNIYGIYDFSGGGWEYTAAVINNGNSYISSYGKAEHVLSNKIRDEYAKYYDIYEPGDEEKEGGAFYGVGGQNLWSSAAPYNVSEADNNIIRKRLTDATYAKMASKNGDGLYEVTNGTSYFGKYTSGTVGTYWLIDTVVDSSVGSQLSRGWNNDYMLMGYAYFPWFLRSGGNNYGGAAGIYHLYAYNGNMSPDSGFRSTLILGLGL